MKTKILVIISLLTASALHAGVATTQELIAAIEKAIATKDAKIIESLTYTEGMSEEDKSRNFKHIPDNLFLTPTQKVELGDVGEDQAKPFRIHRGLKFIPTAQPIGTVLIYQKSDKFSSTGRLAYSKVNGLYYLIGVRSEKLNWEGQPDKSIGWMIGGPNGQTKDFGWMIGGPNGQTKDFKYSYNASGVILSDTSEYASSSFSGQYIIEVSFTSESDDFSGEIVILESGKEITRSETFKGKGTFTYKRKN